MAQSNKHLDTQGIKTNQKASKPKTCILDPITAKKWNYAKRIKLHSQHRPQHSLGQLENYVDICGQASAWFRSHLSKHYNLASVNEEIAQTQVLVSKMTKY